MEDFNGRWLMTCYCSVIPGLHSKYRFIKLDLATVGKFCFHFSHVLGSIVDYINVNPSVHLVCVTPCKYVTPSHKHLLHSMHKHVISIEHNHHTFV